MEEVKKLHDEISKQKHPHLSARVF